MRTSLRVKTGNVLFCFEKFAFFANDAKISGLYDERADPEGIACQRPMMHGAGNWGCMIIPVI